VSSKTYRWLIGICIAIAVTIAIIAVLIFLKRPTVVPDVVMKPVATATQLIEGAGLRVGTEGQAATGSVGPGLVAQQSPGASSKVPRRSSVDITVSVSPTAADIPQVTGLTVGQALQKLNDSLYIPTTVDILGPDTAGVVLDQLPGAGVSWMTGRPVVIGVAAGPDDGTGAKVPNLKGDTLATAQAKLAKVGLVGNGFITQINDKQANVVVDQLPEGGVVVGRGTTVLLLFQAP
jgi:serine/threonine-protein kinase